MTNPIIDAARREAQVRLNNAIKHYRPTAEWITLPDEGARCLPQDDLARAVLASRAAAGDGKAPSKWSTPNESAAFPMWGELRFSSPSVYPCRGLLPWLAQQTGPVIVPAMQAGEASYGLDATGRPSVCYPVGSLAHALEVYQDLLGNKAHNHWREPNRVLVGRASQAMEMRMTPGLTAALKEIETALRAQRPILLVGPPGSGKTLVARHIPSMLGIPSAVVCRQASLIHSRAGLLSDSNPVVDTRPFRAPHHTVSVAGFFGNDDRPGELALAYGGVLFMDEVLEFRSDLRARLTSTKLTETTLVMATNPCPCGYAGHPRRECGCSGQVLAAHESRVSGTLAAFDAVRVDLEPVRLT